MGFLRQKGLISGFLESKYFKNSQSPHLWRNIPNGCGIVRYRYGKVRYRNFLESYIVGRNFFLFLPQSISSTFSIET